MTVEQFRNLREPAHARFELRHGEVFEVTRPTYRHAKIQRRLRDGLNRIAGQMGVADTELAYRPLPEHELWVADVAYSRAEREASVDLDDNPRGSPDLVIDVLSPSNDRREIRQKAAVCFSTGSLEFPVVDPDQESIVVYTGEEAYTYAVDGSIPVDRFFPGQASIPVATIFSPAPRFEPRTS